LQFTPSPGSKKKKKAQVSKSTPSPGPKNMNRRKTRSTPSPSSTKEEPPATGVQESFVPSVTNYDELVGMTTVDKVEFFDLVLSKMMHQDLAPKFVAWNRKQLSEWIVSKITENTSQQRTNPLLSFQDRTQTNQSEVDQGEVDKGGTKKTIVKPIVKTTRTC
jgi:hypothetical protein